MMKEYMARTTDRLAEAASRVLLPCIIHSVFSEALRVRPQGGRAAIVAWILLHCASLYFWILGVPTVIDDAALFHCLWRVRPQGERSCV